jgi:hypothetical protein
MCPSVYKWSLSWISFSHEESEYAGETRTYKDEEQWLKVNDLNYPATGVPIIGDKE